MKRIYGIIAALILSVAGISGAVYFGTQNYEVYAVLESEGVAITDDSITRNLLQDQSAEDGLTVDAKAYEMSETVYVKNGRLFLGEDKLSMSSAYPLFVNEGSTLYCLADSVIAITEEFESVPTYQGLYVSEGISFNQDMERAYRENFLFLELTNGLYMNAMDMEIKASNLPGKTLENNAVIRFQEEKMSWYSLDGERFVYDEATGLNEDSIITINGVSYIYYELLEELGLYGQQKSEEIIDVTPTTGLQPTEELEPTSTAEPTSAPTFTPTPTPTPVQGEDEEAVPGTVTRPSATPTPTGVLQEEEKEEQPKPTKMPQDREWEGEISEMPLLTPSLPLPALPAAPAEEVEEVEPLETPNIFIPYVPSAPPQSGGSSGTKWKVPKVSLTDFSSQVYTIYNEITGIENSEFIHNKGIVYQVFELIGEGEEQIEKLATRRAVKTKGTVKISGLKPETNYKVVVTLNYRTGLGTKEEVLATKEVLTKKLSDLPEAEINYSTGETYYENKAEIKNIGIKDYKEKVGDAYEDMFSNIKKVELFFVKDGAENSVRFSSGQLTKFKTGELLDWVTGKILESNAKYEFYFVVYDGHGNAMPNWKQTLGEVYTCKRLPQASIELKKNEVKDIEIKINVENPDAAAIEANSVYFEIYQSDSKEPLQTEVAIQRKDGLWDFTYSEDSGKNGKYILDPEVTTWVRFIGLLDYETYTIRIYANYNIDNDALKKPETVYTQGEIGMSKITTAPLSTLGYTFFNVEVSGITEQSANVRISLDKVRTNELLLNLLSYCKIEFRPEGEDDSENMVIAYADIEAEADDEGGYPLKFVEGGSLLLETEKEMEKLRTSDGYSFSLTGLDSMTKYELSIVPVVEMGSGKHAKSTEITASFVPKDFTTLRQTPTVLINSSICMSNSITLYDVEISDKDATIINGPVYMYVFDMFNNNIYSYLIPVGVDENGENKKVAEINLKNLEAHHTYTFRFYANEINIGANQEDKVYYKKLQEIYYDNLAETEEVLTITTGEGLSGKLDLKSIDIDSVYAKYEVRAEDLWVKDTKGNWKQGGSNSQTTYAKASGVSNPNLYRASNSYKSKYYQDVFKIEYDFGTEGCNSFSVGYDNNGTVNTSVEYAIYTEDPRENPDAVPLATSYKGATTRGWMFTYWTKDTLFTDGTVLQGVQTLYLRQTNQAGATGYTGLVAVRFSKRSVATSGTYAAQLQVNIRDVRKELGDNPAYYLRIYEKESLGQYRLADYQLHTFANNGQMEKTLEIYKLMDVPTPELVETVAFEAADSVCDVSFNYPVTKNREYRIEMMANLNGYVIKLGEVSFKTGETVNTIETFEDLCSIGQDLGASYVVTRDIEIPKGWTSEVLSSAQAFKGTLDFQGHTLTKNYYGKVFNVLAAGSVLENLRVRYADDYDYATTAPRADSSQLVYENYGTIRNLMVEYNLDLTQPNASFSEFNTMLYYNRWGGIIENFTVQLKTPLYFNRYAGFVYTNLGVMRNGYVYGEPIRMLSRDKYSSDSTFVAYRRAGAIAAINNSGALIENCYSSMDVYSMKNQNVYDGGSALIAGENEGAIKNCFATGTVYAYDETAAQKDTYDVLTDMNPLFDYSKHGPAAKMANNFFYSEENEGGYEAEGTYPMQLKSLYDTRWYDTLFNKSESSVKNQFKLDMCTLGFYPHVEMPEYMPAQTWVSLPAWEQSSELNLINVTVEEQREQDATVIFTFDNSDGAVITEISARYLDIRIENQYMQDNLWRVEAEVFPASATVGYYSEYEVTGFKARYSSGMTTGREYTESEYRRLPVEFYRSIKTVSDWSSIKENLKQNYRLYADIDFAYYNSKQFVVAGKFEGKLDGNGHTIRNISFEEGSSYAAIFPQFTGSITNLNVENFKITSTKNNSGKYRGFAGEVTGYAYFNNIHFTDVEIVSTYTKTGTLFGHSTGSNASVYNCSVKNAIITSVYKGNHIQTVGGLIGGSESTGVVAIQNCFVDNLKMWIEETYGCTAVGGLIGSMVAGSSIENCYVVNSDIYSAYKATGGIIGSVPRNTYFTASRYVMNHVLVDATIRSATDNLGGFVGYAAVANDSAEVCGFFLGQVYSTNKMESDGSDIKISAYEGYAEYTAPTLLHPPKLYTTKTASVNGEVFDPEKAARTDWYKYAEEAPEGQTYTYDDFVYFSYEELCNLSNYGEFGLDLGDEFVLDGVTEGKLPKLKMLLDQEDKEKEAAFLALQSDYAYRDDAIMITKVTATEDGTHTDSSGNPAYTVAVTIEHPKGISIESIMLDGDYLTTLVENGAPLVKKVAGETKTELSYTVRYTGYVDRYFIEGYRYTTPEAVTSSAVEVMADTTIPERYLAIRNVDEWNRYMTPNAYGQKGFNISIEGDLDFAATAMDNLANDVVVNRLRGNKTGEKAKISGINLTNKSFVKYAYGDVSNLAFDNILLNSNNSSSNILQYVNVIGAARANVKNIEIRDVEIDVKNTVRNGFIGEVSGTISGVTMDGVIVRANSNSTVAGALVGRVNNLAHVDHVTAKNIVVASNNSNVGGIIGYEADATHITYCSIENFLVYTSSSNAGGISGYAKSTVYGTTSKGLSAKNGAVLAKENYAGGIFGDGVMSNTADQSLVENVFISAGKGYAGGAYGSGYNIGTTTVKDSVVAGGTTGYIGGLVGHGRVDRYGAQCLDTVVTTVYARSTADKDTNDTYQKYYDEQKAEVQAILENSAESSMERMYAQAAWETVYEDTPSFNGGGWKWKPETWENLPATYPPYIGGAIGNGNAYNVIVANCEVGAIHANYVGGIVGRQSYVHDGAAKVYNCGIQGGSVSGWSEVGGIVGRTIVGATVDCYSATTVQAYDKYAGGITGRLMKTNNASYPSSVQRVFTTSDVRAKNNYAGGIIGCAEALEGDNRRYLFAGSVAVTSANGTKDPVGVRVGAAMYVNFADTYEYQKNAHLDDMKDSSFYTGSLKFETKNWSFNGLANGWMPYLQYSTSTRLPGQEGYTTENGIRVYNAVNTNNGGIQIPGWEASTTSINKTSFSLRRPGKAATELPTLTAAYSAEVDKLNLEFSSAAEAVMLKIEANGKVIAELPMTKRCYTLNYDYRTDLLLTLSYADQQKEYEVLAQNVARNIMVWKENYFYIAGMGVEGSRATIAGSFVHLYEGKALAANGDIYDVVQGTVCGKAAGVSLLAETIPFRSAQYEDSSVDTYYGYSVVDGVVRDDMRLYVKGQSLFAVAPKLTEDYDAVLVDTTADGEITTVLYRGTIKDLTDVGIAMPKEFENADIWQMTNNLDSDSCYVLVRYADGAVAGFNYMTGDELPIDTVRVYGTNTDSATTQEKSDGTNFAAAYEKAKEFEANLIGSGWTPPEEALEEEEAKDTEAQESIVEEQPEVTVADMVEQPAVSWPVPVPTWSVTPTPLPEGTEYAQPSEYEAAESGKEDSLLSGVTEEMQEYVPTEKEESGTVSGKGDATEGAGSEDGTGATGEISGTDNKTTVGGSAGGGTLSEAENAGKADADKDPEVQEAAEEKSKKKEPSGSYIPYFDPELGEYVIFDKAELLSKSEEKPVSMNEQVRRSGHMIEKYSPFMAESIQNNQDNRLGVGLFSITLLVIAALIVMLMIKQKPDGVKHEEN